MRIEEDEYAYSWCEGENETACGEDYCNYCSTENEAVDEIESEWGEWYVNEDNRIGIIMHAYREFKWGTEELTSSECGVQTTESYQFNGCIEDSEEFDWDGGDEGWDYYDTDNGILYETNSNGLILKFQNDDYDYEYYEDEDWIEDFPCIAFELRTVSSFPSVVGCTDANSDLYNPFATIDDGSCDEGCCYEGCDGLVNRESSDYWKNKKSR